MSGVTPTTEASFLQEPCYCGHSRERHRARSNGPTARCLACLDQHFFERPALHERKVREQAIAADPTHIHGPTHTAYACPGFRPFQVCDACGQSTAVPA